MKCSRCGKELKGKQVYSSRGKALCEDCFMHEGLFPLGHTGHLKNMFKIKDRKSQ